MLSMGLVLGFQHATDADHVAAVSTIVADQRRVGAAARVGVAWGLGHSTTVVLAGGAMVASGVVLPERAAQSLEMVVAAMLIVLVSVLLGSVPSFTTKSTERAVVLGE